MRWSILTLAGITAAIIVGITHAAISRTLDCVLGHDDLCLAPIDPFGPDGYGPR